MTTSGNNILSLPFRKATHLSFSNAAKQYISDKYDQHPDMFRYDLDRIDSLRRDAVNVRQAHPSGVAKLQAYAAQLVWMGVKFPIDIGCDFSWYPALGYNTDRPIIRNNLKFELINVLFNLAALYSQLAVASNRASDDGLKTAANHFMRAAGVLNHIKTNIVPDLRTDPPDDMDDHALDSISTLFLAQAQECFWHKAVKDGIKDATIAKLAAQVSDFYSDAATEAVNSQAISSSWIHHMSAKHHHFAAAAQYRAARDCLEKGKYGEEVSRLKLTVECAKEGLNEAKGGYISQVVQKDLQALEAKAKEDLKRAEKDNDIIYLQVVPEKSELNMLGRALLSKMQCPPEVSNPIEHLDDGAKFGPALFLRLVPFVVHMAVSIYEQSMNRYITNNIIAPRELMDAQIAEQLQKYGLPASFQSLDAPLGIPPTLVEKAEFVQQQNVMEVIPAAFAKIEEMRKACIESVGRARDMLTKELEEDEELRKKYGTQRWSRPISHEDVTGAKQWKNCGTIENYLAKTDRSDKEVKKKWDDNRKILAILCGRRQQLLDFVPSSRRVEVPPEMRAVISELRATYSEILALQRSRRRKLEAVQTRIRLDDNIRVDILPEALRLERKYPNTTITPADFDTFFDSRIHAMYGPDEDSVVSEREKQDKLLSELATRNREFEKEKRAFDRENEIAKDRQDAIQQLENAYNDFRRIIKDTAAGEMFYNELAKQIDQMRTKLMPWVEGRRKEARELEAELNMPHLETLSISTPATPRQQVQAIRPQPSAQPQALPPTPQQQQQQQRVATSSRAAAPAMAPPPPPEPALQQSWASQTVVPQQPKPMPASGGINARWTPDMGIKFGPPAVGQAITTTAAPSAVAAAAAATGTSTPVSGGVSAISLANSSSSSSLGNSPTKKQQKQKQKQTQPQPQPQGTTWDQSKPLRFG